TSTGVDAQASAVLTKGTAQACVNTTLLARTPTTASISGSAGRLEISGPFYGPGTLTLSNNDDRALERGVDAITGHHGLCFEAAHLATLIAEGASESPLLPISETVSVLRIIDEIRRQIGVIFPGE
ncbi:MAG: gfo/Idh/MocA family oxidoreductase, partial [Nakamurella sp.]